MQQACKILQEVEAYSLSVYVQTGIYQYSLQ